MVSIRDVQDEGDEEFDPDAVFDGALPVEVALDDEVAKEDGGDEHADFDGAEREVEWGRHVFRCR